VTASGLLFIGATSDRKFRAYDSGTGSLLWETTMSAPGEATPAVYTANGRQFIAIAAAERRQSGAPASASVAGRGGLAAEGAGHSAQGEAASSNASTTGNAYIAFALPR